jgi:hypothetical protein
MTINQNKCKYCTDERLICSRQEPRCGRCRNKDLECNYPPPGSSPYEEPPALDEAATIAEPEQVSNSNSNIILKGLPVR